MKVLLLAALLLSLGQPITKVYYNDSSQVDDGEIWGSTLSLFFTNDKNITVSNNKSPALDAELMAVRKLFTAKIFAVGIDYYAYTYAFITASGDTLYADKMLRTWRYKNKKLSVATNVRTSLGISRRKGFSSMFERCVGKVGSLAA